VPIDPQIASSFALLAGITSYREAVDDPEKLTRIAAALGPAPGYVPPPCRVHDTEAPGPHGPVPVRVYRPEAADPGLAPGLVWAHGGGFRYGNLDMPESDMVARELSHRAGAVVFAVDYRLAVEGVTYPVPHDDVVAAWRWAVDEAQRLGVEPRRIALGGASAGGNLAAGAALRLRDDRDGVQPSRLLLAYPVMHRKLPALSRELETRMAEVPRLLRFLPDDVAGLAEVYLGKRAGDDNVPGYAMPAEADLAGLPSTVVVTSEYDDLRASADAFAEQLAAAGVVVTTHEEAGVLHGHLNRDPRTAGTDRSLDVLADALTGSVAS
jgi:acetyl esterase